MGGGGFLKHFYSNKNPATGVNMIVETKLAVPEYPPLNALTQCADIILSLGPGADRIV